MVQFLLRPVPIRLKPTSTICWVYTRTAGKGAPQMLWVWVITGQARFGQPFSIADRDVLDAPVAMMNQACLSNRPAVVEGLL